MPLPSATILAVHYALLAILCIYGVHRIYHTLLRARIAKRLPSPDRPVDAAFGWPRVTVQVPVFNEKFVVERIIDAAADLDYPKGKLQIQIIDDSNDDSVAIAATRIAHYQASGLNIQHVRRSVRQGFKAGALADAMENVDGAFIAIFDADFLPRPDFLRRTIPLFQDEKVGLVQSRWAHLNHDTSLLTRIQGLMLDAHFGIEQPARAGTGAFFNFNGTAGVWRKSAIQDAGGWSSDTLTEDIDLSYRAQIKGWKFLYLQDLESPSELPVDMPAFKTQQHRWAKGAIQVMKKMLVPIWKAPISGHAKVEATFHLTANLSYLLMFIDSVFFLLPAVHIREQADLHYLGWIDIPLFVLASLSHAWFFLFSQKVLHDKVLDKLHLMPALLATSIGLGVNNGRAVLEALLGHQSGFVRTPKTGDQSDADSAVSTPPRLGARYDANSTAWANALELCLSVLYLIYLAVALSHGYWIVTPFLALFAIGFGYTGLMSARHKPAPARARADAEPVLDPLSVDVRTAQEDVKAA